MPKGAVAAMLSIGMVFVGVVVVVAWFNMAEEARASSLLAVTHTQ